MLRFDPAGGEDFKAALRQIPGYPHGEDLPIRSMLFAPGALWELPQALASAGAAPERPLWVVMDATPMRRDGADLKPVLLSHLRAAGWQPRAVRLESDAAGQVHTTFAQIERVRACLEPGSAVLSVGSGTVTDIAKHACFLYQSQDGFAPLPFVVYQTANSVSAYTSNMAPVFVQGVKRTLPSRYPDVLVCDLETLRDAPGEMTAAGVGDLLAAFGSYADWWLAYRLGLDATYSEFAQTLMGPLDQIFIEQAAAIRTRSLEGMAVLAKLIALGGLAMSLSHATAPLSGYEHVISHVLDLSAEHAGRPLAQHGSQVALATLLSTSAYDVFLSDFEPAEVRLEACYPEANRMRARITQAFRPLDLSGRVAAECWLDYEPKLDAWRAHRADFADALREWPAVRAHLQALIKPPALAKQILGAVEAPLRFADLNPAPDPDEVRFAFFNAPLIRRRLTLGDLLVFLAWDPERLWQHVRGGAA